MSLHHATTRWSLVQRAAGDGPAAPKALAELIAHYEPAIRTQLAGYRVPGADRDDLYQEFVTRLMEDGLLRKADARRGAFRAYLGTALHRFAANQLRATLAEKRGGGAAHEGDDTLDRLPGGEPSPDARFDAEWARLILERAMQALRAEAAAKGKAELHEALEPFLVEDARRDDYVRIAERFGVRANAVGVAVHRLRARLAHLVREQVFDTVDDEAALERELVLLRDALRDAP